MTDRIAGRRDRGRFRDMACCCRPCRRGLTLRANKEAKQIQEKKKTAAPLRLEGQDAGGARASRGIFPCPGGHSSRGKIPLDPLASSARDFLASSEAARCRLHHRMKRRKRRRQ